MLHCANYFTFFDNWYQKDLLYLCLVIILHTLNLNTICLCTTKIQTA